MQDYDSDVTSYDPITCDLEITTHLRNLSSDVERLYDTYNFVSALQNIHNTLSSINVWFASQEPWLLARDPNAKSRLVDVMYVTQESVRIASLLLQPVIPQSSSVILDILGVSEDDRSFSFANFEARSKSEFLDFVNLRGNAKPEIVFRKFT